MLLSFQKPRYLIRLKETLVRGNENIPVQG